MRKIGMVVVATVVCLGLTGLVSAQDKPRKEGPRPDGPPPILRPNVLAQELGLSDAQKQQVEQILQQARATAQAAGEPNAKRQAWQSAIEQINQNVLNDEQRAKFTKMRPGRGDRPGAEGHPLLKALRQLNLTDEQSTQVRQIMQQTRTDMAQAADPQAKRQVHQAAMAKIRTEVLTEQQRQQLDKIMAEQPRRGDGPASRPHKAFKHGDRPRSKLSPASRPA